MRLRAPTIVDLPELARFFGVLDEIYGYDGASDAELRDWLESPLFDPAADFCVALDGDRLVGWCDVWDQNSMHTRFFADIRAHPRTPGVYAALFDWACERAQSVAEPDAVLRVSANSENEALAEQVRSRGFRLERHFFTMEIDLDEEPPAPVWPDGISVWTFRPEDARAVYEANSEAFADHWDFVPLSFEEWTEFFLRSSEFDPTLWFIAEEGAEIAGYSLCRSERRPDTGYVNILGVRRPWRRRGLAHNLLLHSFHALRRRARRLDGSPSTWRASRAAKATSDLNTVVVVGQLAFFL